MLFRECFRHLHGIERKRIAPTPKEHLRLHRLERPEPWQFAVGLEDEAGARLYPDYAAFYDRLSAFVGVPKERIVVGQGIEGLIRDLVMLCCDPGEVVAFTWPTCAMFDIYASVFGARAAHIVASPDEDFTATDLLAQLPDRARLLILPNPGQPVETYLAPAQMRMVARRCREIGAVLAIDEAYYGFGAETCLPLIDEFENVVVLRTFSKAFGAAGARVGFAAGSEAVIRPLDAVRASGEVSGPSLAVATVLMDRWADVHCGVKDVCAGRDWLRTTLFADDFNVVGSRANHVLVDMGTPERAGQVAQRLKDRGVHVKAGFPAPVDRHLLVTCGSVGLMKRFHAAFCEAL